MSGKLINKSGVEWEKMGGFVYFCFNQYKNVTR